MTLALLLLPSPLRQLRLTACFTKIAQKQSPDHLPVSRHHLFQLAPATLPMKAYFFALNIAWGAITLVGSTYGGYIGKTYANPFQKCDFAKFEPSSALRNHQKGVPPQQQETLPFISSSSALVSDYEITSRLRRASYMRLRLRARRNASIRVGKPVRVSVSSGSPIPTNSQIQIARKMYHTPHIGLVPILSSGPVRGLLFRGDRQVTQHRAGSRMTRNVTSQTRSKGCRFT
ncbi:hypothetical protein BKA70DRAFT_1393696 [Coprinopsis sp. MPI-PUGE-AT-0042]|nr:hypothetical protein BKA70DRAFT_1393696 [Coprinopsis sp. MPI-PUGE-AT-0042]